MKKNIARLGIEPQNCKMSWFETWCLSPLDHEISIENWLIYQYINRGKTSKKPPKCPNLLPSSLVIQLHLLHHCNLQKDNCSSALKTTIGEFGIGFWLEMVGELSGQIYQRGSLIKKRGQKGESLSPFNLCTQYC